MSREWPFYLVIALAALPAPIGIFSFAAFHARTYVLVRDIQRVYAKMGRQWPFWLNNERQIVFVLHPDELTGDEPGIASNEKALLLQHRRGMKKFLRRTFAAMFGAFALAILLLLTLAALNHFSGK